MRLRKLSNSVFSVLLLLLSILFTACGGGGGGGSTGGGVQYVAATSDSFSPIQAKDAKNQPTPVYWKYRINQGLPISGYSQGTSVSVLVNDFVLAINPTISKRNVHMQGAISGDATGAFSVDTEESIDISGNTTSIKDQTISARISVTGAVIDFSTISRMSSPYAEWFIDRTNLDTLALNYSYVVNCSAMTDISFKYNNQPVVDQKNIPGIVNETWTVVDKLPEYTVGSKTYKNVVRVTRSTMMPDISTGLSNSVTMTYWIAKGIGMIRGIGQFPVLNRTDLVVELIETNLTVL